jgi:hypothetical protein
MAEFIACLMEDRYVDSTSQRECKAPQTACTNDYCVSITLRPCADPSLAGYRITLEEPPS